MTRFKERFSDLAVSDPVILASHGFQRWLGGSRPGRMIEARYTGCPFYDNYEQLVWSRRGRRPPDLALTTEVPGDPEAHGPAKGWAHGVITGGQPDDLERVRRVMVSRFDESSVVQAVAFRAHGKKKVDVGVSRDPASPLFTTIQAADHGEVKAVANRLGPGAVSFTIGYAHTASGEFQGVTNPVLIAARCTLIDLAQDQYAGIRLG